MSLLDEIAARVAQMDPGALNEVRRAAAKATKDMVWVPNPGPQTDAFHCEADELLYGGEAGGGKSDLLLGLALTAQSRSLILRRLNGEVQGLVERMEQILGSRRGFSSHPNPIWRFRQKLIYLGGCQHLDDRKKYQGIPKDFIGFDELANFLEAQYTFIIAWARSTMPGQRVRVVAASNPPVTAEGQWIIKRWGPWLDKSHPNPALPGELRWFTTVDGQDCEVDGPGPVMIDGKPYLDDKGMPIYPKSRTFIPAELQDNPDLYETGYGANLAALPGDLREAMFGGDFSAGQKDQLSQVIPGEWVDAAFSRWNASGREGLMTALGCDIAESRDRSVFQPRHGGWFDRPHVFPGKETPDGPITSGKIVAIMRNGCEVVIDMGGGYGGSTRDHLRSVGVTPTLYNGANTAEGLRDRTGIFKFRNIRAAAYWRLRDALDPTYGSNLAIYPDPEIKADLCAAKFINGPSGILIQDKDEIKKIIGRSPDKGDALIMAHFVSGKTNHTRVGIGSMQTHAIGSGRNPRRR